MKATEKYDCSRGVKFATYSQWLIKQQIRRSLHNKGRSIRIPLEKSYLLNKISSLQDDGFSLGDISKRLNVPYEDISYLLALSQQQTDLDFEIQDTRYSPNLDSLVLKETLGKIMSTSITAREKKILELRYGLNGQETYTLREIGAIFGIKGQRVDQLVNRALNKLKIPALKKNLEAFL
jgi:RNA polymerase primary sigma factor